MLVLEVLCGCHRFWQGSLLSRSVCEDCWVDLYLPFFKEWNFVCLRVNVDDSVLIDSWFWSIDAAAIVSFSLLSFANLFLSWSFLFCSSYFSVPQYLRYFLVTYFLSLSLFLILSTFLFWYVLQCFALLALYDSFIFARFPSLEIKAWMYFGSYGNRM